MSPARLAHPAQQSTSTLRRLANSFTRIVNTKCFASSFIWKSKVKEWNTLPKSVFPEKYNKITLLFKDKKLSTNFVRTSLKVVIFLKWPYYTKRTSSSASGILKGGTISSISFTFLKFSQIHCLFRCTIITIDYYLKS